MVAHGVALVTALQPRIDGIVRLAHVKNAQASMRLLGQCANKALDYYLRITPPSLSAAAVELFDEAIQSARQEILQIDDHSDPGMPQLVRQRSDALAQLPMRMGGFGQLATSTLAPCAYLAGVRATQHDPLLSEPSCQHAIRYYTEDAYDRLAYLLGASVSSFPDVVKLLPHSAKALADAPASSSTRLTKTTARKIQAAITAAVQCAERSTLRLDTHPDRVGPAHGLSKSTSIHYHLTTSRSQQSRMLVGSLWFTHNRVESDSFVHYARFYLGLLPLLRPFCETFSDGHGASYSICAGGHDSPALLTTDGAHCISCPVCYAARHAAHERINRVYCQFGKDAGCSVQMNPSTDNALANQFGKQQAQILFPKKTTPTSSIKAALMRSAMRDAVGPDLALRQPAIECMRRLAAECPRDFQGLRVDAIIQSSSFLLWIDVGIVHTTAKSRIDPVLKFVRRLHAAEKAAAGNFALNILSGKVSPPLQQYAHVKDTKYAPMTLAATAQVRAGKRAMPPRFRACIFSHLGEMSPVAISTVETITMAYRESLTRKYFEDGISNKRRTADFRMNFKDALMVANASGFGTTLAAAGRPRAGRAVVSAFDSGGLPEWEVDVSH